MAKRQPSKVDPPSELTMDLFAPGMTMLHRAGLGGLACTLKYIERACQQGALLDDDLPGGPWQDGQPPWEIDERRVTLKFGKAEMAREYLKRLFRIAFDVKDGLIYLPGQYQQEPSLAVRAELQNGLMLTFLQHGRVRKLAKDVTTFLFDPSGDGRSFVTLEYKKCTGYKHQDGWNSLTTRYGVIEEKRLEVIGPLSPGAVVRHNAFPSDTKITGTVRDLLPLYFALVGCLSLPVNRGLGVLIVPAVEDLSAFVWDRSAMTPASARECRIANASDAALQAQIHVRARSIVATTALPSAYAMAFRPTSWASQQKSRVKTISTDPARRVQPENETNMDSRLDAFEIALAELAPRIRTPSESKENGSKGSPNVFWAESVVRPLVAENLALGKPWHQNFTHLMRDNDANNNPLHVRVSFDKKGLQHMADRAELTRNDELALIKSIHRAIFMIRGRIYSDTIGKEAAQIGKPATQSVYNRWNRFQEELRLGFVGAKTQAQTHKAITSLLARAGSSVKELKDENTMKSVQQLLFGEDWERVRDLALFALASYKKPSDAEALPGDAEE